MNPENLYFINTPVKIQDECYLTVVEQLETIKNIGEDDNVYLSFTPIFNLS